VVFHLFHPSPKPHTTFIKKACLKKYPNEVLKYKKNTNWRDVEKKPVKRFVSLFYVCFTCIFSDFSFFLFYFVCWTPPFPHFCELWAEATGVNRPGGSPYSFSQFAVVRCPMLLLMQEQGAGNGCEFCFGIGPESGSGSMPKSLLAEC